jgi:hypothetical protein
MSAELQPITLSLAVSAVVVDRRRGKAPPSRSGPDCGYEPCDATTLYRGWGTTQDGAELTVYACERGHYTAVRV